MFGEKYTSAQKNEIAEAVANAGSVLAAQLVEWGAGAEVAAVLASVDAMLNLLLILVHHEVTDLPIVQSRFMTERSDENLQGLVGAQDVYVSRSL